MRFLWVSFVFVSGVACYPVSEETSRPVENVYVFPIDSGNWDDGSGLSSDQDSFDSDHASSSLPSSEAGPRGHYKPSQDGGYGGSEAGDYHFLYPEGAYAGDGYSAIYDADSATKESGYGEEEPEPVLSDVSDLEPVYSFSSHSRYQHGRAVFAQTSYTPTEDFLPVMPVSKERVVSEPTDTIKY